MPFHQPPEVRARRYRRRAAELRRQADAPDCRQEPTELLAMADQYDRIADRLAPERA